MALYGGQRDISLFRHLNRELMGDIVSQECVYYKLKLAETKVNIYGESAGAKYYYNPIILSCLIDHQPQEFPDDEFGVQFHRLVNFKFLRDDLLNITKDNQHKCAVLNFKVRLSIATKSECISSPFQVLPLYKAWLNLAVLLRKSNEGFTNH